MSDTNERAVQGGNNPPVPIVNPPTEGDVLADLAVRYPNVEKDIKDLETAAATYGAKVVDDAVAGALQALLKKVSGHRAQWKGARGEEKKPWDRVAKIVQGFFATAEDRAGAILDRLKPVYDTYLSNKAERERLEREARLEAERAEGERLRNEAAAAEQRRAEAEEAERQARVRETEAREREAQAKEDAMWAEARAELAAYEERRLRKEREDREKLEREQNRALVRNITAMVKQAERLNEKAETGKLDGDELAALEGLILEGGQIGQSAILLSSSLVLEETQRLFLNDTRLTLKDLRDQRRARIQKEDEAAAAQRAIHEEEAQRAAEEARAARAEQQRLDQVATDEARAQREEAERARDTAKAEAREAKKDVRSAMTDAREATEDQKDAGKDHALSSAHAEKTEKRADRMERKLENTTSADLSRTRGEYGTVGSLARRWTVASVDFDKVDLQRLRPFINMDAISAAATKFMRENQGTWTGDTNDQALAGVIFERVEEGRVV